MERLIIFLQLAIVVFFIGGCGKNTIETMNEIKWTKITSEEAKEIIDNENDIIILDVRSESEYKEGHISNSILIPVSELESKAENLLKEKEQTILIYCRSGNRSAKAAEILSKLGYTNIYDFGGINSWTYGIEKEKLG